MMSALERLPAELLTLIVEELDIADKKTLRAVSKICRAFMTPFIFRRVTFSLDRGGIDKLERISRRSHVAPYIRKLKLERRDGIRKFDDFSHFHDSACHQDITAEDSDSDIERHRDVMTRAEWHMLGDEAQRHLYKEYESDRISISDHMRQEKDAVLAHICRIPGLSREHTQHSAAENQLSRLLSSLEKLPNISRFTHKPKYLSDEWGRRWRRLEFRPSLLRIRNASDDAGDNASDDAAIETLQLFITLYALRVSGLNLRSVNFYVSSNWFQSTAHLVRLFQWHSPDSEIGSRRTPVGRAHRRALRRSLEYVEDIASGLTGLSLYVHTKGQHKGLAATAKAFARWLHKGKHLERVTFRCRPKAWRFDYSYPVSLSVPDTSLGLWWQPRPEHTVELVKVAEYIFGVINSSEELPALLCLHLSLPVLRDDVKKFISKALSLRHLELSDVGSLTEETCWSELLEPIVSHPALRFVKLYGHENRGLDLDGDPYFQPTRRAWHRDTRKITNMRMRS